MTTKDVLRAIENERELVTEFQITHKKLQNFQLPEWTSDIEGVNNRLNSYFIDKENLFNETETLSTWLEHLDEKSWFTTQSRMDFIMAYANMFHVELQDTIDHLNNNKPI